MKEEFDFYLQNFGKVKISNINKTELKNLVSTGENFHLEFKQKVSSPEKIAKEICAFANSKGGKILVGIGDNGEMTGLESYLEEEFWIQQAAEELCKPKVDYSVEIIPIGKKDVLLVNVNEAQNKPIYVVEQNKKTVYIRHVDESVAATENKIEILKNEESDTGVVFEYGDKEQMLFSFLSEYGEITVDRFSKLINVTTYRAGKILINLTKAGILSLFERDNTEYFTFAPKNS